MFILRQVLLEQRCLVSQSLNALENRLIDLDCILTHHYSFGDVLRSKLLIPLSFPYLPDLQSPLRVDIQYSSQNAFGFLRKILRQMEISREYLFIQFVGILIFEGQITAQHCKENDPARPDIDSAAFVLLPCDHLRRSVARRTAGSLQLLA